MSWKSGLRWLPALVMMIILFLASNTPASSIPTFGVFDTLVKKAGHMLGYALLASAYWYGMNFNRKRLWLAFTLALLYAASDEFHQTFTAGRHPSWVDVIVFDGSGAAAALFLEWSLLKKDNLPGGSKPGRL